VALSVEIHLRILSYPTVPHPSYHSYNTSPPSLRLHASLFPSHLNSTPLPKPSQAKRTAFSFPFRALPSQSQTPAKMCNAKNETEEQEQEVHDAEAKWTANVGMREEGEGGGLYFLIQYAQHVPCVRTRSQCNFPRQYKHNTRQHNTPH
jgi:hypothetical protein